MERERAVAYWGGSDEWVGVRGYCLGFALHTESVSGSGGITGRMAISGLAGFVYGVFLLHCSSNTVFSSRAWAMEAYRNGLV